ncbi:MAG: (2E,6E)-farnesyl diphosphate synthase [Pseudomonadales bacterium]|nr:(2E,6E)-farnesyl diphosphate synthase [Pseudomonadales bacterium]
MSAGLELQQYLQACRKRVDTVIDRFLPSDSLASQLQEGMRYATLNGGKRIRPVLVYATAEALGANPLRANHAACAVELVHSYSLVHDDLPSMDDDDLRRGKPTCHIAFDEATAILVGDALQSLAYEVLAADSADTGHELDTACRLDMITTLAEASGTMGMAAGQAIDLASEGCPINLQQLQTLHSMKTGKLIRACVRLGALSAGCSDPSKLLQLDDFAANIGIAFQVQDDILDVTGDTDIIGKQTGADAALNKATYPSLLGLHGAQDKARELHQKALKALALFDHRAAPLRLLSEYVVTRTY